jgi:hypothetical protein
VRARYDLSSQKVAIHAAAPCAVEVKRKMIEWWGPIIDEYYAATEGMGATFISSADWLAHPGSVGRSMLAPIRILDDAGAELPEGEVGTVAKRRESSGLRVPQASTRRDSFNDRAGRPSATWDTSTPTATLLTDRRTSDRAGRVKSIRKKPRTAIDHPASTTSRCSVSLIPRWASAHASCNRPLGRRRPRARAKLLVSRRSRITSARSGTSTGSCPVSRPASSTSGSCAIATGRQDPHRSMKLPRERTRRRHLRIRPGSRAP